MTELRNDCWSPMKNQLRRNLKTPEKQRKESLNSVLAVDNVLDDIINGQSQNIMTTFTQQNNKNTIEI